MITSTGNVRSNVTHVPHDLVRRPFVAPRRGSPLVGIELPEHLDKLPSLLAEHLEKMLGIQVAFAGESQV